MTFHLDLCYDSCSYCYGCVLEVILIGYDDRGVAGTKGTRTGAKRSETKKTKLQGPQVAAQAATYGGLMLRTTFLTECCHRNLRPRPQLAAGWKF